MNGLLGLLTGGAVALALLSSASGDSDAPAVDAAANGWEPGEADATEQVVGGHTSYATLEIGEDDSGPG